MPIVAFDTPLNQQVVEAGTDLYVNVGAIDVDGTVAGVALYLNGQFVRTDAVVPYEWGRTNQNDILLKKYATWHL
ncbi:MAG: hypothetical protein HC892_09580, partial [Saprospiraceae bacterium]|nr:hypothetical protein [Saprospiraceae bacterium]